MGPFTKAAGTLAYYEVCQIIKSGATVTRYAKQGDVVVAIKGDQWIGYDDVKTMKSKVKLLIFIEANESRCATCEPTNQQQPLSKRRSSNRVF